MKQILRDDAYLNEKLAEAADAPEPVLEEQFVQPKVELEVLNGDETRNWNGRRNSIRVQSMI
jgi:hypothetical protein